MSAAPKYMAVQGAALIVAAAVTLVGLLGFVPGVTTHIADLTWVGQRSDSLLFGVFAVSIAINALHLLVGIAGVRPARTYAGARAYLLLGGAAYLALWLYGLLVERGSDAHVLPLNGADNWLHFGMGFVMLLLAVTLAGQHDPTKRRPRTRRREPSR